MDSVVLLYKPKVVNIFDVSESEIDSIENFMPNFEELYCVDNAFKKLH